MKTEVETVNQLRYEKSPYLLQHADNPVDWMPWGQAAFDRAKREDRPVFLSIGYAACHWCHVMARESFDDDEAAEAINRSFVAVKVDDDWETSDEDMAGELAQSGGTRQDAGHGGGAGGHRAFHGGVPHPGDRSEILPVP
ncbi:MAG: DUF255 domain-containing protein [Oscillospiraceae bacterium]|nr:DUF255 domain-containing protein [Oscillospiraceae bacterium]